MSLPHGWQNELQGLLDRLQDGGFTEQDRSRLNDLLHAGPEPQDFFITYLEIDSGLTWDGRLASDGGQPSLGGDELPPDLSVDAPQRTDGLSSSTAPTGATEHFPDLCVAVFQPFLGGVLLSYLIVAIFLGTGILAASRWNASDPRQAGPRQQAANPAAPSAPSPDGLRGEPIALVTGAAACQWADPKTAIQRGLLVPLGWKFAISSGLLEVTYPTGTRVIVQGPATYTANRHNGGFLWAGKLSVRVGPRTIVWRKTPQGMQQGGLGMPVDEVLLGHGLRHGCLQQLVDHLVLLQGRQELDVSRWLGIARDLDGFLGRLVLNLQRGV